MSRADRIVAWNEDRELTSVPDDSLVVYCVLEEVFEYVGINNAMPKAEFKKLVAKYAKYIKIEAQTIGAFASPEQKVDALRDIDIFVDGFTHRLGYDIEKSADQALLHIESRTGSIGADGKWAKDVNQESVYLPRYSECKL